MNFNALLQVFSPAPFLPVTENEEEVKGKYKYWRFRVFYSLLIGYAMFYISRRSLVFAMPGLITDLGFDKSDIGLMTSTLAIAYGMSKFGSGILADRSNPRYFMAIGLFLTGICNLLFGLSSSFGLFIALWAANGVFQGFGWPPCARSLTNWYSHTERGSWWSSVSVAHNIGSFLTPWIVGFCLQYFGWRAGMYVPGIVCILGSVFLLNRMRDAPQTLGLPPVEKFRNDYTSKADVKDEQPKSTKELLKDVLSNKFIWILALAYFFLYFLRQGISDWMAFYLFEIKGYSMLASSGAASLIEVGGFFGCLVAGWSSDRLFNARRGPTCTLFAVAIISSLFLFWMVPAGYTSLDSAAIIFMGFAIFGPQMLIGMCASEISDKKSAATANGFVGWIAYIGAAVAGYPMGLVIDNFGWGGAFAFLFACSLVFFLLLLPLWNVTRATVEQGELKKAKAL